MLLSPQQGIRLQGGANRVPQGGVSGIPEDGSRRIPEEDSQWFPTECSDCFSPGRGLLFSRKMAAVVWRYVLALGIQ